MFVLTSSGFFTVFYVGYLIYALFAIAALLYYIPVLAQLAPTSGFTKSKFFFIAGLDISYILLGSLICVMFVLLCFTHSSLECWYGHILISNVTNKLGLLAIVCFLIYFVSLGSASNFIGRELFDFCAVCVHFCIWFVILFLANTLLAVFFIFEMLATLIFLLLITSCFSAVGNFRRESLSSFTHTASKLPNFYLNSLMFFFWTSMLASLGLFFFSIHFLLLFYSYEWTMVELLFMLQISNCEISEFAKQAFAWFGLLLCLFVKCGLAPFFMWKPSFFKGIPIISVWFYTTIYYFLLLTYFFILFEMNLPELMLQFAYLNLFLIVISIVLVSLLFLEATYVKPFFAFSSMLNSIIMFTNLNAHASNDYMVFF